MKKLMPLVAAAAVLAIAFIIGVLMFTSAWQENYKSSQTINVTGSAKRDLVSDLGILRINIFVEASTASEAYALLEEQKPILFTYLAEQGFPKDSVTLFPSYSHANYEISPQGYQSNTIRSYQYSQRFEIWSSDVALIKNISLEIASLVQQGLNVQVESPEYYYTKLSDIKIDIQAEAAKDAMERAKKIATATGSELGPMTGARMGVLQITPRNSNMITDYGLNDVSSIEKEITAVVSATFILN